MYRVNVLENVINRQRREQKENRVDVYRKILSDNDVFFEDIQKGTDDIFQEI